MHFIGILTFCCLSVLISAQELNHGKLVSCIVLTQSILDIEKIDFNYDEAHWQYCTHVLVLDDKFKFIKGKLNSYFLTEEKIVQFHAFLCRKDVSPGNIKRDYDILTNLRKKYPHLKVNGRIRTFD